MNHTGTAGLKYGTARKLAVTDQLLVSRKLAPAMPIMQGIVDKDNENKDMTILILMALGALPDESADLVTRKCLSVVTAADVTDKQVPIQAPNGSFMFQEVSLQDVLHLTALVIEENLGDFFRTALSSLSDAAKQTLAS